MLGILSLFPLGSFTLEEHTAFSWAAHWRGPCSEDLKLYANGFVCDQGCGSSILSQTIIWLQSWLTAWMQIEERLHFSIQRTLPSHSLDQKEKAYLELFMSMFGAQFMDSHCLSVKARRYRRKIIPKNSPSDHLCFEHRLLTQSTYYHLLFRVLRQVLPAFCPRILVDISDKVDWSVLFLTLMEVYMIFWGFVFWFCLFGALFLIMEWHL